MKYLKRLSFIIILTANSLACNKSSGTIVAPASLNIINAVATGSPVIPVLGTTDTIHYYASANSISYTSSGLYSAPSGSNTLYIVKNTDTTRLALKQEMFNGSLNLVAGGIYSFFLTGDTTKFDTLFVQDHIPYLTDSSAGVRFVNLSTGSQPMNITIDGNPASQAEFSNLAYKNISGWNKYPVNSMLPGYYNFTIRDQATGDSLTSFIWNYTLFRNNTVVISGSEAIGSSTPLLVFQMNNY